jgi:1-acyl-sn-glycerol-3-phosphate acyltransferase
MFVGVAWYNRTGGGDEFVYLVHDAMLATPLLGTFLRKMGAAKACRRVADDSLKMGRKVMIYPGGNYEAFRPYSQRFKVDFGGKKGFIRTALRHRVPIVPVVGVGAHESFIVLWRGENLVRRSGLGKLFRVDSFPIGLGLPWGIFAGPIFHFPLPAKIQIEVGDSISLDAYGEDAMDDEDALEEIYQRVMTEMQAIMDRVSSGRRLPVLG